MPQHLLKLLIIFAAFCGLNSHAQSIDDDQSKAQLGQRVEQRWDAMSAFDFKTVFEFSTPQYRRVFTSELFQLRFGRDLSWDFVSARVLDVDAETNIAKVQVNITAKSRFPVNPEHGASEIIPEKITEFWLYFDNQWWYIDV